MTDSDRSFCKYIPKFRSGLRIPFSGNKDTLKNVVASCSEPLVPMCQNARYRFEEGINLHYYLYANGQSHYKCVRFRQNTHYLQRMFVCYSLFTVAVYFIVTRRHYWMWKVN